MRVVYYNGKFVPESDAKISIFDSALMFGDMVFEMTRSFQKKQFKLKEHIDRLYASMEHVKIPLEISKQEMEEICYKTIEKNESEFLDTDEHRLMINVSRGPLSIYSEIFNHKFRKNKQMIQMLHIEPLIYFRLFQIVTFLYLRFLTFFVNFIKQI